MSKDELLSAVGYARDRQMAELLTVVIGISAESHPEELRKALSQVFDLSAVEESARRAMLVLSEVQAQAYEVRELISAVQADVDALERRIGGVEHAEHSLTGQYRHLKSRLDNAAKMFADIRGQTGRSQTPTQAHPPGPGPRTQAGSTTGEGQRK